MKQVIRQILNPGLLLLSILGICIVKVQAQQLKKAKIMVLTRPYKDSILIRWAPTTSASWMALNKQGYIIKRLTLTINGKSNPAPYYKVLTVKPLKPWPMAAWETFVNMDDKYGSIVAQALYGEDFEITQENQKSSGKLINKLKQNEQRYSFALFCADQSFKVAKAMALGFVDTTAKSNEKYIYEIVSATDKRSALVEVGRITTSYELAKVLPKPTGLKAEANGKAIMVSWDIKPFFGIFTHFSLERSEDGGKSYKKTSGVPVINTTEKELEKLDKAFQLDTISEITNKAIVYRVKGVTPFGEFGPASDTISVPMFYHLETAAVISEIIENNGTVKIDWKIPPTNADVLGFDIERSDNPHKGFLKINKKLLSSSIRSFLDVSPLQVNFYRIKAYGKGHISTKSLSKMIQMADSIPPAPPVELAGEIDKKGIVKLVWKPNTEQDMFGYRVFRGNAETDEFMQITKNGVKKPAYIDTVSLNTLSKYVYYKLVAVDKRYNPSGFSAVVKLKRPDIVPPSSPVFTSVKSTTKGVYLSWYNSSSNDVVKHEVIRSIAGLNKWESVATFTDTVQTFLDVNSEPKMPYSYKIRATDDSNLQSESKALTSQRLDLGLQPDITTFKGIADRDNHQIVLKWEYKYPGIKNYILYRAEENKPLRIYKTIDAKLGVFTDTQLYINNIYQYRIKAVFADGTESRISKGITVNY